MAPRAGPGAAPARWPAAAAVYKDPREAAGAADGCRAVAAVTPTADVSDASGPDTGRGAARRSKRQRVAERDVLAGRALSLGAVSSRRAATEPEVWCVCRGGYFGAMVQCDEARCAVQWFHFGCVGLAPRQRRKAARARGGAASLPAFWDTDDVAGREWHCASCQFKYGHRAYSGASASGVAEPPALAEQTVLGHSKYRPASVTARPLRGIFLPFLDAPTTVFNTAATAVSKTPAAESRVAASTAGAARALRVDDDCDWVPDAPTRSKAPSRHKASRRDVMVRPPLPSSAPSASARCGDFFAFMQRREALRLRKEADSPWPWTGDDIFQRYKFTNVRREDDRVTRWLRLNRTAPFADAPVGVVLLNCALFRIFGTVAFSIEVGWIRSVDDYSSTHCVAAAARVWASGRHAFTRAYCRPRFNAERRRAGTKGGKAQTAKSTKAAKEKPSGAPTDVYATALRGVDALVAALPRFEALILARATWQEVCALLRGVTGFGGSGFFAKEVLHDASGWPSFRDFVLDEGSWTPPGPGARRGLNRLHQRDLDWGSLAVRASPAESRFVAEMACLVSAAFQAHREWAQGLDLSIHDVQFQLCEFDKYERIRQGGRGTSTPYRPLASALFDGAPGVDCRPSDQEWDLLRPAHCGGAPE